MKHRVGVTGQQGFVGTHLCNYLKRYEKEIEIVPYSRDIFSNQQKLIEFCFNCDTIVHLAAMNRGDEETLYQNNMTLVHSLITALEEVENKPHIIFSSSTQEERNNAYGRSKREGRILLEEWAAKNGIPFTGIVIPNVFGPFGRPFYNSVVSTFCSQLTHDFEPKIEIDAEMKLLYVEELVASIYSMIRTIPQESCIYITPTGVARVSDVLEKLTTYRDLYFTQGIVPQLNGNFDRSLFNTFRSYIESDHFPIFPAVHKDERGMLVELVKEKTGGQTFFSFTKPGITRGNHYHTRKFERFCVISGKALIRLRRIGSDSLIEYPVSGDAPCFIDIAIYHTHDITNTGNSDLIAIFWSDEIFNPEDPDTFYEKIEGHKECL